MYNKNNQNNANFGGGGFVSTNNWAQGGQAGQPGQGCGNAYGNTTGTTGPCPDDID